METKDKILKFCLTPKTAIEIADHVGVGLAGIYTQLLRLQRLDFIEKIGDGRRRANPATFVTIRKAPKVLKIIDGLDNLAIKHAHNPFQIKVKK